MLFFHQNIMLKYLVLTLVLRCNHEFAASQVTLPVQTLVGWNASFNFQLSAEVNDTTVSIRNMDQGQLLMRVKGNAVVYEANYKNRTEFTGNLSTRQISFILRNVTLRDAGLYTAQTLQLPGCYGEQTLIVKASPSKPQIVEVKTPVSGLQSSFRCSTHSNSAPVNHGLIIMSEWEFRRNNQLINPGSRYSMAETNLTITGTSYEEDNDVRLTCVAYEDLNAKSEKSDEFLIKVKYGPHNVLITGDPLVNEGGKLTLTCSGDCNPPCSSYQWQKGSQPTIIGSSPSLMINNINRGHAGVYTCTVNNSDISNSSATQIAVTVNYGPDIAGVFLSPSNRSYELSELSSLTVQCSATCVPKCNYQWMGPNISQNNNMGVLSITEILRNQAGNFTCTVTNSRIPGKSAEVSFSVIVDYPPVLTMTATNTTKEGRLVIYCTASGVPNKYKFFKWTQVAPDENRTIVSELEPTILSDSEVSVTRERVTYQDSGFYVCKASNGIPNSSTGQLIMENMVFILIAETPEKPINFHVTNLQEKQLSLRWLSGYHGGFSETFVVEASLDNITWNNVSKVNAGNRDGWFSAVIEDLIPGSEYYFRLYAYNENGRGDFADVQLAVRMLKECAFTSSLEVGASVGIGVGGAVLGLIGAIVALTIRRQLNGPRNSCFRSKGKLDDEVHAYSNTEMNPQTVKPVYEELNKGNAERNVYDKISEM